MTMQTDKEIRCPAPAVTYGKVLFGMECPCESVEKAEEIFREVPQLLELFRNPVVPVKEKYAVIDRVFPEEMRNFLKTVCKNHRMDLMPEIFAAYRQCMDEKNRILHAVLTCTTPPDGEQMQGLEAFLRRKYGAEEVRIEVRRDDSLLGGFILRAGSDEYDRSIRGGLDRLAQTLGAQ